MRTSHVFKILFFIAFAISLYLFLAQGVSSGIDLPNFDKVAHFLVFAGLSLLFDLGFNKTRFTALTLALIYGALVEYLQSTTAYREASIGDLAADMAGGLCYYYLAQAKVRSLAMKYLAMPQ